MGRGAIPSREPVGDAFTGVVLAVGELHALALRPHEGAEVILNGSFVVRYGARFLGKPHISIVPGLIALDYGDILTGDAAWDFLMKRSNLHPRADVMGYRNDGVDDMVVVKWLDLALTPEVLVYPDATATLPVAEPAAFIGSLRGGEVPSRVLEYLPQYDSVAAWIDALESKVNLDD